MSPRLSGAPWVAVSSSGLGQGQAVPDRFVGAGFVDGIEHQPGVVVAGIDGRPGVVRGRSGVGHAPLHGEIGGAAAAFDEHLLAVDDDELAVGKARFGQGDGGLRRVDGRGEARLLVGDVELPILMSPSVPL